MSSDEIVFQGRRFHVVRIGQRTAAGQVRPYEVVRHPGSVVILPMVDAQTVCLIRNLRVAVNRTLIELPAGTREANEDPLATAQRELVEETGYVAKRLDKLHEFYMAPGVLDEQMTLVLATELTPGRPEREPGEEIENLLVPWATAIAMARDGEICDAKTIVGLLYFDRFGRPH
jgi:ADP-ribose pyrophosphatase